MAEILVGKTTAQRSSKSANYRPVGIPAEAVIRADIKVGQVYDIYLDQETKVLRFVPRPTKGAEE